MSKVIISDIQNGKPTKKGAIPKILSYTENGKPNSILVFDPGALSEIGPGDTCELETSTNGKWENFESIKVISKAAPGTAPVSGSFRPEDPEKQKAIHRSVALEYATSTVVAFGGKISVSKAITDILDTAQAYYKFLQDGEVDAESENPDEEPF